MPWETAVAAGQPFQWYGHKQGSYGVKTAGRNAASPDLQRDDEKGTTEAAQRRRKARTTTDQHSTAVEKKQTLRTNFQIETALHCSPARHSLRSS